MTTRTKARKVYNLHRAEMFKELKRQETDDDQLNEIGRREFGAHWGGVHPQDRVKLKPYRFYIANTDTHEKPGLHWMGVYTGKNHAYLYDSYGRDPKRLVRHLIKNINQHGYGLGNTDHRPDQIGYTSGVCGEDSLAWLLTVRDLGIRAAAHV